MRRRLMIAGEYGDRGAFAALSLAIAATAQSVFPFYFISAYFADIAEYLFTFIRAAQPQCRH